MGQDQMRLSSSTSMSRLQRLISKASLNRLALKKPVFTAFILAALFGAPARGLAASIPMLGSTFSASAGLVGSLAPLGYSPGTMAQLLNQSVGQVFGLLTQLFS